MDENIKIVRGLPQRVKQNISPDYKESKKTDLFTPAILKTHNLKLVSLTIAASCQAEKEP